MFQLIVAVISIALIALMVVLALYWGGSAHDEAAIRAQYAGNMNAAAQIEGALQLNFQNTATFPLGDSATVLEYLVQNRYLTEIPKGNWVVTTDTLYKPIDSDATLESCIAMNRVAGLNVSSTPDLTGPYAGGCPPCNGATGTPEENLAVKYKNWPGCQLAN